MPGTTADRNHFRLHLRLRQPRCTRCRASWALSLARTAEFSLRDEATILGMSPVGCPRCAWPSERVGHRAKSFAHWCRVDVAPQHPTNYYELARGSVVKLRPALAEIKSLGAAQRRDHRPPYIARIGRLASLLSFSVRRSNRRQIRYNASRVFYLVGAGLP